MHTLTLTTRQLEELILAVSEQAQPDGQGPTWVTDLLKVLWDADGEGE